MNYMVQNLERRSENKMEANIGNEKVQKELALGSQLSLISLVNYIVDQAHDMRASDIHIDPGPESVAIRYRIDGVLQDAHGCPKNIHSEIISRIKILAGLRIDEHQAAQDGRFRRVGDNGEVVDVRVSIVPTYHGENAVLRLLSDKAEEFTLESLGFSPNNIQSIVRALKRPYGMILATGPTGSGKTTTMYALVKMLNISGTSVVTIEDPIEYAITGINQIQVSAKTALTFANGLKAILRQDPNIIMVGEIRDSETASIAVNTALTGHLVLSTLHTNDAATTLPRLLDLKIESYLIASTVTIVIGQRLVRKICEHCKTGRKCTEIELESLIEVIPLEELCEHQEVFYGTGCTECNFSGYKGRVGIHEVLVMDENIRQAVLKKMPASQLKQLAIKQGMVPLIEDGFKKAWQGMTTVEEVLRMLHE
jgi:type II secretory ATPase GspE/PulE/Tfp pilus assembly ATPase PilB-like protein